jgi:hypothetical protein
MVARTYPHIDQMPDIDYDTVMKTMYVQDVAKTGLTPGKEVMRRAMEKGLA